MGFNGSHHIGGIPLRPPATRTSTALDTTIGQLLDHDLAIAVACPVCRRRGVVDPRSLAGRKFSRAIRSLKFRCSCGALGQPVELLVIARADRERSAVAVA